MYIPPITSSKEDVITTYADIPPIIDQSQEDIIKRRSGRFFTYTHTHTNKNTLPPPPAPAFSTHLQGDWYQYYRAPN